MATHVPALKPIIEGASKGETLFFIQGWPDDHTMWDETVAAVRDRYRCVRVDMPNYAGVEYRRWGYDHEEVVEALVRAIRQVSPGLPVTLVAHDWGAYWAYWLHHQHPELVSRIVGLDIAPDMQPTPREILMIIAYQWWLLGAFVVGGGVGDWMTRRFAKMMKTPRQGDAISSAVNYPYLYTWRDIVTGRASKIFRGYSPEIPVMFIYGEKKPGRFHSDRWLELVRSRPGNRVVALDGTGHWVTKDSRLKGLIGEWLDGTRQN